MYLTDRFRTQILLGYKTVTSKDIELVVDLVVRGLSEISEL
jgi:hypothetical protein